MRRVPAVLTLPSETPATSARLKYELQRERFIASHMNILRIRCNLDKVKLYYNVTMIPKRNRSEFTRRQSKLNIGRCPARILIKRNGDNPA